MADIRPLSPGVWVASQPRPEDMPRLAALGVRVVVTNRPDGEDPGQPTSAEIATAARLAGMDHVDLPIRGSPTPDDARTVADLLAQGLPMLLYCRSGMRSTCAWAMAESIGGARSADEIRATAARAGYDLTGLAL